MNANDFLVEISEFQSTDEAFLPQGSALNEPPDDCSCSGRCLCGFSTTIRSTD